VNEMIIHYAIYITHDNYAAYLGVEDYEDYDENRFFKDKNGDRMKFDTKEEAQIWLNENVKYEKIYPSDRIVSYNQEDFMR
jgi:hypothetical protein